MKVEKSPTRPSSYISPIARSSHLRGGASASTSSYSALRRSSSHFGHSSSTTASSPSTSRFREPAISRSETFSSEYEEGNPHKWTKKHWKKLEECYLRKDRDYEKAASEFYYIESLQDILLPDRDSIDGKPIRKEYWSKEQILWRCKCLDTSAKFHGGLLPSERKKVRKSSTSNESSASADRLRRVLKAVEDYKRDLA